MHKDTKGKQENRQHIIDNGQQSQESKKGKKSPLYQKPIAYNLDRMLLSDILFLRLRKLEFEPFLWVPEFEEEEAVELGGGATLAVPAPRLEARATRAELSFT